MYVLIVIAVSYFAWTENPIKPVQVSNEKPLARQVFVMPVVAGWEKYGLKNNDILLEIDGVFTTKELFKGLGRRIAAGEKIPVAVYRITEQGGILLRLVLGEEPQPHKTTGEEFGLCQGGSIGYGCNSLNQCQQAVQSICLASPNSCSDCSEAE